MARAAAPARRVAAPDGAAGGIADGDAPGVLLQRGDLGPAPDVDAELAGAPVQERLEVGLGEHGGVGPSGRAGAGAPEAQQRGAGRVAPLVEIGGLADLAERRPD